jgi:hypothetical protein
MLVMVMVVVIAVIIISTGFNVAQQPVVYGPQP